MDKDVVLDQIESVLMGMSTDQIKDFLSAAKARAAAARRANSKQARKDETRRLILDGQLLGVLINQGRIERSLVEAERDKFLTKNTDRALWGLPEIEEPERQKRGRGRPKKTETEVIKAVGFTITGADPTQPFGA